MSKASVGRTWSGSSFKLHCYSALHYCKSVTKLLLVFHSFGLKLYVVCRIVGWAGDVNSDITLDPEEVKAVKLMSLEELREAMALEPQLFTIWFREEIELLNWFQEV